MGIEKWEGINKYHLLVQIKKTDNNSKILEEEAEIKLQGDICIWKYEWDLPNSPEDIDKIKGGYIAIVTSRIDDYYYKPSRQYSAVKMFYII